MTLGLPPDWRRGSLVFALLAALCFLGLGRNLWTPDEPREAELGRETWLAPGVIPTLDGERFYEKPPLYYWTLALAYRLAGGPSPAAARAVSAVAALLTLAALYWWALRAASPRIALLAVAMLATGGQFLLSTHWVLLDPLLMLIATLAAWAGWEAVAAERRALLPLAALYLCLALSLWTKGLIGPVLAAAGLALFCWIDRQERKLANQERALARLWSWAGVGFLVASVAALAGAIYLEGGRQALWEWGWVNHVQRLVAPRETGHRQAFYYYLYTLPVAVLPWLVPLAGLLRPRFWRQGAGRGRLARYCGALAAGGLVILSLSATKRETYLLPLLPPLALLMAIEVEEYLARASHQPSAVAPDLPASPASRALQRLAEWGQAGLVAVFAALPAVALVVYTRRWAPSTVVYSALAAGCLAALGREIRARRLARAAGWAWAATLLAAAGLLLLFAPELDREKSFLPALAQIDARLPSGAPVYAVGTDETLRGIVPFVTGRRVIALTPEELTGPAAGGGEPPLWVLAQVGKRGRVPPELEQSFSPVVKADVGRDRHLSLWRRNGA